MTVSDEQEETAMMLTAAWMRLARRTLRHHRVLFRLSVVLTATWMRLARGAMRFERARLAAANAQAAYEKS